MSHDVVIQRNEIEVEYNRFEQQLNSQQFEIVDAYNVNKVQTEERFHIPRRIRESTEERVAPIIQDLIGARGMGMGMGMGMGSMGEPSFVPMGLSASFSRQFSPNFEDFNGSRQPE